MVFDVGVAILRHGGILSFSGSTYKYEGGLRDELVLDEDKASYAEVRDFLTGKHYVEANFRIYYKCARGRELKILHSDTSSVEFGHIIADVGEAELFVAHGLGINDNHIPYIGGQLSPIEPVVVVNEEVCIGAEGKDREDNEVVVNEEVRIGAEGKHREDNEGLSNTEDYGDSLSDDEYSISDPDYAYDDYSGQSDDSDDDELSQGRANLRNAANRAKKDLSSLTAAVKQFESADRKCKEAKRFATTGYAELDLDEGAQSDKSYDTGSDGQHMQENWAQQAEMPKQREPKREATEETKKEDKNWIGT